jgi:hypothetical protein
MTKLLFETWIKEGDRWRRYGFRLRNYCSSLKVAQRLLDEDGYEAVEIRKYFYTEE